MFDPISTSATGKISTAGGYVGGEQRFGGGRAMFFNSRFVGKEVAEKIIHDEGLGPGS